MFNCTQNFLYCLSIVSLFCPVNVAFFCKTSAKDWAKGYNCPYDSSVVNAGATYWRMATIGSDSWCHLKGNHLSIMNDGLIKIDDMLFNTSLCILGYPPRNPSVQDHFQVIQIKLFLVLIMRVYRASTVTGAETWIHSSFFVYHIIKNIPCNEWKLAHPLRTLQPNHPSYSPILSTSGNFEIPIPLRILLNIGGLAIKLKV